MNILSSIMSKVFPATHPAVMQASAQSTPTPNPTTPSPMATPPAIDVNAVLSGMAAKHPDKLNWSTSIVDLMKLLGLDSSLNARKQLAQELHYSGDMNDSSGMNVWLHSQVMKKFAENGGTIPSDLMH